jgi:predicted O-linked N-acetylglucosamine transferase (SPINDLY family)
MKSATPFVYRPRLVGPPLSRAALCLPKQGNLYVCPQSIYKFHPEFDAILGEILRRDPAGRLVLIRWAYAETDVLLIDRFRHTMPDVVDRVVFIPRLQQAGFLHLLAASDVLLDPIHFGGGLTGLEGLALGKPIVTWPSPLLRGRITAGLYAAMGVSECTAVDFRQYVDIAVRLGTDPDYRRAVQEKILAANGVLFENDGAVREWESFLRAAVQLAT